MLDLSSQERSNVSFLTIDLAPTMTGLNMSRINTNKLELSMILVLLTNKNQLSEFVFSHNSLAQLQRIVINEPNPNASLDVDLSHNRISNLGSNLLTESISKGLRVTGLDISNNRLGLQFDKDTEDIFENYRHLKRLNLSSNDINVLTKSIFVNLTSLEELDLSDNYLNKIQFKLSHMINLRHLNLANNAISRLD